VKVVLDSSAVLAMLWDEPGAARVVDALPGARISAVNLAEVTAKLVDRGASDEDATEILRSLGLDTVAFDPEQARAAGLMRRATQKAGLSLGDRACLALARAERAVALTADRAWTGLSLGVDVEVIR
jgi:PIN domain nuclease of toxin-antitoxin system